jgi:putative transcriptional regulator
MDRKSGYLDGQFLIAMPGMEESSFSRSVVYLCAHSGDGAMGLIINKSMAQLTFRDLLVQLEIIGEGPEIKLPAATIGMRVHRGGPVETGRGFVLHTSDYHLESSTLPIDDSISLTATLEILKAIAEGRGPEHAMLALGYAGWGPGQLENEIQQNGWLTAPADQATIFESDLESRYARALGRLGIDPALLSTESGHA